MADSIDLIGRLLCVADVFDALTSARSFRGALSRSDAMLLPARAEG